MAAVAAADFDDLPRPSRPDKCVGRKRIALAELRVGSNRAECVAGLVEQGPDLGERCGDRRRVPVQHGGDRSEAIEDSGRCTIMPRGLIGTST